MSVNGDIQDAIKKHLPEMVGKEITVLLNERLDLLSKVENYSKIIKNNETTIEKLENKNSALEEKLSKHKDLTLRENAIIKRENELEVEILKIKLQASEYSRDSIYKLMEISAKNNKSFMISESESKQIPIMLPGQSYPTFQSISNLKTTNVVENN